MNRVLFLTAAWLTAWPLAASAHGTQGWLETKEGMCLVARYDDGEPMRFGEVVIIAPGGEQEFQTGRTDGNGLFLFAPDKPGKWRVTVNDGMGHRLVLSKTFSGNNRGDLAPAQIDNTSFSPLSRAGGAVTGISLLIGATGWFYGLRQRNLRQRR